MNQVISNDRVIKAFLDAITGILDMTEATPTGPALGDRLADVMAEHTRERSLGAATDPEGDPWAELNPLYEERKGFHQIGIGAGPEGGNMLSLYELGGERELAPDHVTITYGRSAWARVKAEWFCNGADGPGDRHQPARNFWGLDDEMRRAFGDEIAAFLAPRAEEIVRRAGGY